MRQLLLSTLLLGTIILLACQPDNKRSAAVETAPSEEMKETVVKGNTEGSPQLKGLGVEMNDPNLPEKLANMKPKAHNENPTIEIMGVNMKAPVNPVMVMNGKKVWENGECGSCHSLDKSPSKAASLHQVLGQRKGAFIINMMYHANPVKTITGADREMVDRCGHRQKGKLLTMMEARDLVEFFRANEGL